jgi:two-component system, LytTR family, response regulator
MKYKTVIVDDEKNCIEVLEFLCKEQHTDLEVVATFSSSLDALAYLKSNTIDLLFLDIQMPFLTGIELLQSITYRPFYVVFTTAFDQYALKAIKLSALDYLLKPIDDEHLSIAIEKFRHEKNKSNFQDQLSNFIQQHQPANTQMDKIAVAFHDKIIFYDAEEILYCQSNDNYTTIHLANGEKSTASKTIKHFEDILTPYGFIRSHQSYLINKTYIEEYSKKDGGFIVLKNKMQIPVSRNKKDDILHLFKNI